jgi:hypothetical protein
MKQRKATLTIEILTKVFPITHNVTNTRTHIFFTAQKSRYNENHEIALGHIDGGVGKWKGKYRKLTVRWYKY